MPIMNATLDQTSLLLPLLMFRLRAVVLSLGECTQPAWWKSRFMNENGLSHCDWAHLAYTIWPDRVREACKKDRSIAIAHGLEDLCEVQAPESKKKGGRVRRNKKEKP